MNDQDKNPATEPQIETPEYVAEISKEATEEIAAATEQASAELAAAKSDDEKEKIVKEAEAKRAAAVGKAAKKQAARGQTADAAEEPKAKKIQALRVSVSGTYVKDRGSESYSFEDIVLPACQNVMSYLKQAVMLRFKDEGIRVPLEDIIEYFLDDEQETEMEATFLNKDIFEFTEYEVLCAKIYYKLKQVVVDQGIRQARVSLYKACCRTMGRPVPADTDTQIKSWPKFKLVK